MSMPPRKGLDEICEDVWTRTPQTKTQRGGDDGYLTSPVEDGRYTQAGRRGPGTSATKMPPRKMHRERDDHQVGSPFEQINVPGRGATIWLFTPRAQKIPNKNHDSRGCDESYLTSPDPSGPAPDLLRGQKANHGCPGPPILPGGKHPAEFRGGMFGKRPIKESSPPREPPGTLFPRGALGGEFPPGGFPRRAALGVSRGPKLLRGALGGPAPPGVFPRKAPPGVCPRQAAPRQVLGRHPPGRPSEGSPLRYVLGGSPPGKPGPGPQLLRFPGQAAPPGIPREKAALRISPRQAAPPASPRQAAPRKVFGRRSPGKPWRGSPPKVLGRQLPGNSWEGSSPGFPSGAAPFRKKPFRRAAPPVLPRKAAPPEKSWAGGPLRHILAGSSPGENPREGTPPGIPWAGAAPPGKSGAGSPPASPGPGAWASLRRAAPPEKSWAGSSPGKVLGGSSPGPKILGRQFLRYILGGKLPGHIRQAALRHILGGSLLHNPGQALLRLPSGRQLPRFVPGKKSPRGHILGGQSSGSPFTKRQGNGGLTPGDFVQSFGVVLNVG
ncbi:translation initiation factor IF-2-like [Penaeus monodon]|uniref:translation initiation factor IF-2-like n=1 Tax=Penaeus monodon TaxID=6687 RepID=UPI0018A72141|nr:translation initiation factor IF-2-like [Penaeus monodon]